MAGDRRREVTGYRRSEDRQPETPLGHFLREQWIQSGKSLKDFAHALGISVADMTARLFTSNLPPRTTLAKLRTVFGDQMPPAPGEVAGAVTSTQAAQILGVYTTTVTEFRKA